MMAIFYDSYIPIALHIALNIALNIAPNIARMPSPLRYDKTGLIADKMMAIFYDSSDSTTIYGKTINNPRRWTHTHTHIHTHTHKHAQTHTHTHAHTHTCI
jgi:hypothetical protein